MEKFKHKSVYSYEKLAVDLAQIKERYPEQVELRKIGLSVEGRDLFSVKIGSGNKVVLCHGAHHAREWMTSWLIVDLIKHLLESQSDLWRTMREDWLTELTFWFIPMVNPDGVTLVQEGADHFFNQSALIDWNDGSNQFMSWKANSRGVDLNRQYPVDWEAIQADPGEPKSSHFKGKEPLSEPESLALAEFVNQHPIDCAIAYHSSGEEIFWRYNLTDDRADQHRPLAEKLVKATGYQLIEPKGVPSGGGFTDWFLTEFNKPAFTIEIAPSVGPRPVPNVFYERVFNKNEAVLATVAKYLIDQS